MVNNNRTKQNICLVDGRGENSLNCGAAAAVGEGDSPPDEYSTEGCIYGTIRAIKKKNLSSFTTYYNKNVLDIA